MTEPSSAPDWAPRSASSRDPRAPCGGRIRGTIRALALTSLGILFVALTGVVGCTEKEPPLTPEEVRGFQHFVARITEDVWPSGAGGVDVESLVFLDPMERRFIESLRSKGVTTLRLVSFDVQLGIIVDLPLERDDESSWLVSFEVSTHGPVLRHLEELWRSGTIEPEIMGQQMWPPGAEALKKVSMSLWNALIDPDAPMPPLAEDDDIHPELLHFRHYPEIITRPRLWEVRRKARQTYKRWDPKVYRFSSMLDGVRFVALDGDGEAVAIVGLGYFEKESGVPSWSCCTITERNRKR